MNRSLDLASVRRRAAAGFRIVTAENFGHVSIGISFIGFTLDVISVAQTHLFARSQTEVALGRLHHEVRSVNIKFFAESKRSAAGFGIFGIVDGNQRFNRRFRIVDDFHRNRVQDRQKTRRSSVEFFSYAVFQTDHICHTVKFGDAHALDEVSDCCGVNSSAAQSADRGHTRIIPAVDMVFFDQLQKFAFAHDGIVEVQP